MLLFFFSCRNHSLSICWLFFICTSPQPIPSVHSHFGSQRLTWGPLWYLSSSWIWPVGCKGRASEHERGTRGTRGQGASLRALASFTHTSAAGAGSLTRVFLSSSGPALSNWLHHTTSPVLFEFHMKFIFPWSWSVFLYIYSY